MRNDSIIPRVLEMSSINSPYFSSFPEAAEKSGIGAAVRHGGAAKSQTLQAEPGDIQKYFPQSLDKWGSEDYTSI